MTWSIERYISLLLGEIPKLYDNQFGYGPNGKGFIKHVNVPEKIYENYLELVKLFSIFRNL